MNRPAPKYRVGLKMETEAAAICFCRVPVGNTLSSVRKQYNHGSQEESDAATTKVYT